MAQTKIVAQNRNFFSDGHNHCLLEKGNSIYRVLFFTGKSFVETVVYPSKKTAMDAVNYYLDEQKKRRVIA